MRSGKVLFVDRDGTLVDGPAEADRLENLRLMPGVIPALLEIQRAGFALVMVAHRDHFELSQAFLVQLLASQGVTFEAVFVGPLVEGEARLGSLREWVSRNPIDRSLSAVVGNGDADLEFAHHLGVRGLRVRARGSASETWETIASALARPRRRAEVERKTLETRIRVSVDLEREGPVSVRTGIGFLDHMLEQIARHGGFALELDAEGDLHVDEHHTVEDCALALGQALRQALGDKRGIGRYGFLLPMDEAQSRVALDLSGRPYLVFEGKFHRERIGELPTELVPHFFRSLADALGAAIHIHVQGENTHHMVEACFKGVGRALRQAVRREGVELPSSKGVL
jgi:imidazoleglycerol-phosphate dehydratase/histidinol-phosphatase